MPCFLTSERPGKVMKLNTSEEYYVISEQDGEAMEEDDQSSQNDVSQEMENPRGFSKKPQRYRVQWEDHPSLKSEFLEKKGRQRVQ